MMKNLIGTQDTRNHSPHGLLSFREAALTARPVLCLLLFALLPPLLASADPAGPAKCYDWILHTKLRGGYLSSSDPLSGLAQMKAAGMNAVMPKFGSLQYPPTAANLKLLGDWGKAAAGQGLYVLPVFNFRGGKTEKILSDRREVTVNGELMQLTPCPLDEEFWNRYILDRAVFLAAHAKELGLTGAIIDPEMYGADHTCFATACYCDDCLREFAKATGLTLPAPLPELAQRAAWLKEKGLAAQFQNYFVDRIKGFCRRTEREVHATNPDFLLGVLHLDDPLPFQWGMAMGLGTATHPVLGFSEATYSNGYTDYVDQQSKTFAALPAQVLFVPGLWQQQFPAENLAEQYYTCAAHATGYWIYTLESLLEDVSQKPGYALLESPARYWAAMQTANAELDKLAANGNKYVPTLQVRPFDPPLPVMITRDIRIETLFPAPDDNLRSVGRITLPRLRHRNPLFILGKAGEPVVVKLVNLQLAHYLPGTQWVVVAPDGTRLMEGHLKVKESTVIKFTPGHDGVFLVVADSDQNSQSLSVLSGQRNAFRAAPEQRFTVNGRFGKMYFYVPQGVTQFSVFVKAEGQAPGRGGKLEIKAPSGEVAARLAGGLGSWTEIPVQVPAGQQGKVWGLSAEDLTNDLISYLSPNLPGYLSPEAAKVLTNRQ